MTEPVVVNPYIYAAQRERRRVLRVVAWSFFLALAAGFAYAQIARHLGVPSGFIGITAIIAQAATFYCVLVFRLGKFWL